MGVSSRTLLLLFAAVFLPLQVGPAIAISPSRFRRSGVFREVAVGFWAAGLVFGVRGVLNLHVVLNWWSNALLNFPGPLERR